MSTLNIYLLLPSYSSMYVSHSSIFGKISITVPWTTHKETKLFELEPNGIYIFEHFIILLLDNIDVSCGNNNSVLAIFDAIVLVESVCLAHYSDWGSLVYLW